MIIENKNDYTKLYIKWLFKYPSSSIKGFIDETSGYYNGSYSVNWPVNASMVNVDKVNVSFNPLSKTIHKLMDGVIHVWTYSNTTALFIGLGFNFFVFVLLLLKSIYEKKNIYQEVANGLMKEIEERVSKDLLTQTS